MVDVMVSLNFCPLKSQVDTYLLLILQKSQGRAIFHAIEPYQYLLLEFIADIFSLYSKTKNILYDSMGL